LNRQAAGNDSDWEDLPETRRSSLQFPVVGIGASAGGMAAALQLFEHLPEQPGMAFVVVLHLSPEHESHAAAILQRATRMPVVQVTRTEAIQVNHVYVIAPALHLAMDDGKLVVETQGRPRGRPVAIDLFFRTLAQTHQERAIAVVLSGTGSDGALGLGEVKAQGGVSIAQAPPRPNTQACRWPRSPRAGSISSCPRPRFPPSSSSCGRTPRLSSCRMPSAPA
jgi:two-component system CheB/CheR fusion protein